MMRSEWETEERTAPYRGQQLTDAGRAVFPSAMRDAIVSGGRLHALCRDVR